MQFERPHHQRIAHVLAAMNWDALRQHGCLFGGGTRIALRYGEYRESVDIDFLVSDAGVVTGSFGTCSPALMACRHHPPIICRWRRDCYASKSWCAFQIQKRMGLSWMIYLNQRQHLLMVNFDPAKAEFTDSPASILNGVEAIPSTGETGVAIETDLVAVIKQVTDAGLTLKVQHG